MTASGSENSTLALGDRHRKLLVPAVIAALGLISTSVGVGLLVTEGSSEEHLVTALLEPADKLGPESFTDDFAALPVVPIPPEVEVALPPTTTPTNSSGATIAPTGSVVRVSAATPGLYGGTQDNARCNTSQLTEFLDGNPQKAGAWVEALNIDHTLSYPGGSLSEAEIGAYIDTLTPAVLLADTLVVNNGFSNGEPTPRDAVLQKGTAVLVDNQGVPRTRCACGNPLTQPAVSTTEVEATGEPWPGYSATKVVVVESLPAGMSVLSLVDLTSGETFDRPVGTKGDKDIGPTTTTTTIATTTTAAPASTATTASATTASPVRPSVADPSVTTTTISEGTTTVVLGTGDVQATLRWSTDADLDLYVTGPDGETISYNSPTSSSGGWLDVDHQPNLGDNSQHVENVFWPTGQAPPGVYAVWVHSYDGVTSQFSLEVRSDGVVIHSSGGSLAADATSAAFEFTR